MYGEEFHAEAQKRGERRGKRKGNLRILNLKYYFS